MSVMLVFEFDSVVDTIEMATWAHYKTFEG